MLENINLFIESNLKLSYQNKERWTCETKWKETLFYSDIGNIISIFHGRFSFVLIFVNIYLSLILNQVNYVLQYSVAVRIIASVILHIHIYISLFFGVLKNKCLITFLNILSVYIDNNKNSVILHYFYKKNCNKRQY